MTRVRQRGFSLLELLVTLLVIVLATSLVVLNVGSGDRDVALESDVRQIGDGAQYALDEAQFTGTDYGLLLRATSSGGATLYSWSWLERGTEGWRTPASGKDVFAGGDLPPGTDLQLEIEDVALSRDSLFINGENPDPQVILYSSGETPPGAIDFRSADGALLWRLEWGLLGDFRVLPRGQADAESPQ